jgi:dipeptidase D
MVTSKNADAAHDFDRDPIKMRRLNVAGEGRTWIGATGTTLGADNGLGVAAALALLEGGGRPSPPIQALFTVDEETGLNGAAKLDAAALGLTGKTMLNLDMEEWPNLYIGCAGGGDSTITIPLSRASSSEYENRDLVEIRVDGLMGGHSGLNIHEDRANAILLCARATQSALHAAEGAALVSIRGGDKHNAIPREATATLAVPSNERQAVEESVRASAAAADAEFGTLEKGLRIHIRGGECSEVESPPLDESSTSRLLSALLALPHGPLKYSHALPGLVETSNNLAAVICDDDSATVLCSSRSSIGTALESVRDSIKAVAFLAGGSVKQSEAYPGWNPNPASSILDVTKRLLTERLGRAPGVNAVHAGLECGVLIEKLGGNVDAISFGPTIEGAHSPDERVDAETVAPFYELVEDILAELAEAKTA